MTMTRTVSRSLFASVALLALAACGGGGGGGGGAPAFRVQTFAPGDGAQSVARDAVVRITLTQAVDPASVTPTSITLAISGKGNLSGSVTLVAPDVLEFAPAALMRGGTTHFVTASAFLRSTTGAALGGDRTSAFLTTGSPSDVILPSPNALRETAGHLQIGRRHHTATRLTDGRVLIAGGFTINTQVTDRAETFAPGSEVFTLVSATMRHPRAGHTAMKLQDGRVLLAGGSYEVGAGTLNSQSSAEVFDPTTNTFTDTGSMALNRTDAAALLLPDGRVLVTGGSRPVGAFLEDFDDAEVWSPWADTWTPWPNLMSHVRATHGALDLGDGRVLLAGGAAGDTRADLLSLSAGTFTPVAEPPADSDRFGACMERFASGHAIVAGGDSLGSVLYFDTFSNTMLQTGSGLNGARTYATATRIDDDRILVAGGLDANTNFVLSTCDLVAQGGVAGSRTFATQVHFTLGIADHTATVLLDGRILYAGGLNPTGGASERNHAYVFQP